MHRLTLFQGKCQNSCTIRFLYLRMCNIRIHSRSKRFQAEEKKVRFCSFTSFLHYTMNRKSKTETDYLIWLFQHLIDFSCPILCGFIIILFFSVYFTVLSSFLFVIISLLLNLFSFISFPNYIFHLHVILVLRSRSTTSDSTVSYRRNFLCRSLCPSCSSISLLAIFYSMRW